MQRSFGGTAFEPAEQPCEKELTLGPVLLTALAVGLVALCAVCFFTGYAMGRHANPALAASVAPAASGPSAAQLLANPPKPTATQSGNTPQAAAQTATTADAGDGSTVDGPAATATPGQPAVVQTALPAQAGSVQPAVVNDQIVHAALPQTAPGGAWMVQIAAVSHSEDADVLVSALRKHGYSVSSKHDAIDNLIHVQVGPFATHADAATMRQKLLNDGYNAIIQP